MRKIIIPTLILLASCGESKKEKAAEARIKEIHIQFEQQQNYLDHHEKFNEFKLKIARIMRKTGISEDSISREMTKLRIEDSIMAYRHEKPYLYP